MFLCIPRSVHSVREFRLCFDGSFMSHLGRGGLGLTLAIGMMSPILHLSVPLVVSDSLRAEVCGLPLGALIVSTLRPALITFVGDN